MKFLSHLLSISSFLLNKSLNHLPLLFCLYRRLIILILYLIQKQTRKLNLIRIPIISNLLRSLLILHSLLIIIFPFMFLNLIKTQILLLFIFFQYFFHFPFLNLLKIQKLLLHFFKQFLFLFQLHYFFFLFL
jgi:hypothetical protein